MRSTTTVRPTRTERKTIKLATLEHAIGDQTPGVVAFTYGAKRAGRNVGGIDRGGDGIGVDLLFNHIQRVSWQGGETLAFELG